MGVEKGVKANHKDDGYTWTENKRVRDLPVKSGAKVRIKTIRFGKVYAQGLPEYTFGKVIDVIKDQAKVKWQQGDVDMVTRLSLRIKRDHATSDPKERCQNASNLAAGSAWWVKRATGEERGGIERAGGGD